MINIGGSNIINIVINGDIIYKGLFENSIIYQKQIFAHCRNIINTGDWSEYYININNTHYTPTITCNSNNIVVTGNKFYFTQSGEYNIIFNYKNYNISVNCNVIDCTLTIN